MDISVGDTVVHPQHGTATVTDMTERTVAGTSRNYVVLKRPQEDLTLHLPAESCEQVGLRTVIDESDIQEVLDVLREDAPERDESWRKQHARNERRLNSGDPLEIAAAIRDLTARDERRGLSMSDKRLHDEARKRLIGELAAATDKPREEIEQRIDEALEV